MDDKKTDKKGFWARFAFRKNVITGLFIILPVLLSFYVFVVLIKFIINIFQIDRIAEMVLKQLSLENVDESWMKAYFIFLVILIIISFIYLIGLFARYLFIRKTLGLVDSILYKIPIFNKIYMTMKQISNAFWGKKATIFKQVVLVQYPRKGLYTLGFLTLKAEGQIQAITHESVCNVFIPTTPNPTSGYLIMVPEEDIMYLDMSVEDGMKLIVSGGAVMPNNVKNNHKNQIGDDSGS